MAQCGENGGDGPVAAMSRHPIGRAKRVTTAGASARPGDQPLTVEPSDVADAGRDAVVGAVVGAVGTPDRDGRRAVEVVVDGWRFEMLVEDESRAALRERASRDRTAAGATGGPLEIRAIIPGRVVAVAVAPGDTVEAGQTLLAVEAMKMQNELRAPRAGTVTRVPAGAGATVEVGDVLVVIG
jgi:biotin carboxyl carrier protein